VLQDLDELVLKCRDERARAYIREAVTCCKAGAYRSAIVSTWIAVAFDIVDKIHELSLAGDKEAESFVTSYESALANNNTEQGLKIERELLNLARDKYELISSQEFTDLERLQVDRHRCAHPSRMTFTEIFSPPAELARLHIRSAVEYLLQHEPSQGKAAHDALLKVIWSKYFPTAQANAFKILEGTPLKRARPALVRNLILVLIKTTLTPSVEMQQVLRNRSALRCIKAMHPAIWGDVLPTEVTRLYRNLADDDSLARGLQLLTFDKGFGAALQQDQIARLEQFLAMLPDPHLQLLEDMLRVSELASAAKEAIKLLRPSQIDELAWLSGSDEVRDRVVTAYCRAASFDTANTWGKLVREFSDQLTAEQTRAVLKGAAANDQIRGSFQLDAVLASLRKAAKLPAQELDALIAAVKAPPAPAELDDDTPF
jgi:hypothetical protein